MEHALFNISQNEAFTFLSMFGQIGQNIYIFYIFVFFQKYNFPEMFDKKKLDSSIIVRCGAPCSAILLPRRM